MKTQRVYADELAQGDVVAIALGIGSDDPMVLLYTVDEVEHVGDRVSLFVSYQLNREPDTMLFHYGRNDRLTRVRKARRS